MTNLYHLLLKYLKEEPYARERVNKNLAIANLLISRYNLPINQTLLTDVLHEAFNLERYWRLILKDEPSLRGLDYEQGKKTYEQAKEIELGYTPDYHLDVRRLSRQSQTSLFNERKMGLR
jgi:hypothetical protein